MPLNDEQLSHYRSILEAEHARIGGNVASLDGELTITGPDDPEGDVRSDVAASATAIFDHDRGTAMADHERRLLAEIDAALARIDAGTYGICVRTGKEIPTERLDAMPWTDHRMEDEVTA